MTASVLTRSSRALPAGARLIALAPQAAHAVRVLATASEGAALAALMPPDGEDPADTVAREAASLAERIAAHIVNAPGAPTASALGIAAARLHGSLERLRRALPPSAAEQLPRPGTVPLALAQEWLVEAALEHHGHALMLLSHPQYTLVAGIRALGPAEALARAAERVLPAAETWAAHDPLLELEVEAAYWYAERWSARDDEGDAGLRSVQRRMEWALAERGTLVHGEPILATLLASDEAGRWPELRRTAARALVDSIPGAFQVLWRMDDEIALVRSLTDGREIRIRDPYGEAHPGRVMLGRALPLNAREHVFTLSTELVATGDPADLRALQADLRAFAARLPLSAAVEAVVADGLFGARIPRPVAPAMDAEDALARIEEIAELLVERGLAQPAVPVDIPRPPRLPEGASRDLLAIDVDPVLRAWLTAMVAAAQETPASARIRETEERYGT
ncbi:MAG TPA: hypothetical protein VGX50_10725 [Longimicrobium sp.]|jgi:hypothetical protein|nr:hypothetical protein [Longimicrobium sp.]